MNVGTEIIIIALLSGHIASRHQILRIDEIRIPCKGGEGLVRRISIAGRT